MKLIWHILRKDFGLLRWQWLAALGASLLFGFELRRVDRSILGYTGGWELGAVASGLLAAASWLLLVAQAVRQDQPDGAADWVTRPLGWRRIVVAKLLFVVVAVLPLTVVTDLVALTLGGHGPETYWQALVGRALMRLMVLLGVAVCAAVTGSIPQVILVLVAPVAVFGAAWAQRPMEAIRMSTDPYLYVLGSGLAVALLALQWAERRQALTRGLAGVAVAALALFALRPMAVQAENGRRAEGVRMRFLAQPETVRVAMDLRRVPGMPERSYTLQLPVELSGVPEGFECIGAEGFALRTVWKGRSVRLPASLVVAEGGPGPKYRIAAHVDSGELYQQVQKPAQVVNGFAITWERVDLEAVMRTPMVFEGEFELRMGRSGRTVTLKKGQGPAWLEGVGPCQAHFGTQGDVSTACQTPYVLRHRLGAEFVAEPGYRVLAASREQGPGGGLGLGLSPVEAVRFWDHGRAVEAGLSTRGQGDLVRVRRLEEARTARVKIETAPVVMTDYFGAEIPLPGRNWQ